LLEMWPDRSRKSWMSSSAEPFTETVKLQEAYRTRRTIGDNQRGSTPPRCTANISKNTVPDGLVGSSNEVTVAVNDVQVTALLGQLYPQSANHSMRIICPTFQCKLSIVF
jgi:hypothetical protein